MTPIVAWITLCPRPRDAEMPDLIEGLFAADEYLGLVVASAMGGRAVFMRDDMQVREPGIQTVAEVYDAGWDVLVLDDVGGSRPARPALVWTGRRQASILIIRDEQATPHPSKQHYDYVGLAHHKRWADACQDMARVLAVASGRRTFAVTDAIVWQAEPRMGGLR
jgi:hypothetical protein